MPDPTAEDYTCTPREMKGVMNMKSKRLLKYLLILVAGVATALVTPHSWNAAHPAPQAQTVLSASVR